MYDVTFTVHASVQQNNPGNPINFTFLNGGFTISASGKVTAFGQPPQVGVNDPTGNLAVQFAVDAVIPGHGADGRAIYGVDGFHHANGQRLGHARRRFSRHHLPTQSGAVAHSR